MNPPLTSSHRSDGIRTFRNRRRGVGALELVVLAVLVLAVIVAVVGALGTSTKGTFERLSQLQPNSESMLEHVQDSRDNGGEVSLFEIFRRDCGARPLPWLSVVLALLLNLLFWYILFQRSRRAKQENVGLETDEIEPASDSDVFGKRQRLLRMLAANSQLVIEGKLEVRHAMTTQPLSVLPESAAKTALALMKEHRLRHLLVCDANGRLHGILQAQRLQSMPESTCAQLAEVPHTVAPGTSLTQALTTLLQAGTSCLVVTRDEQVQGVVTTTDAILFAQAMLQFLTRMSDRLKPALAAHQAPTITAIASLQSESSTVQPTL